MDSIPILTFVDLVDILVVATLIYLLFRLIRGTRGLYMLMGLLIVSIVFWLAKAFQLQTVGLILGQLFTSLILVIIVIFQHDIRRVLTKVGRSPFFSSAPTIQERETLEELIKTSISLANKKIGALIVLERGANVADHIEQGEPIDALVSRELLTSIFLPVSPLHDGAVLIQGSRIAMAGCLLPLSLNVDAAKIYGTRHRAAMGLTEETDAVVIVVSEERGTVSLARDGEIEDSLDAVKLRAVFQEVFNPESRWLKVGKLIQDKIHAASKT
jgi:diadenylate cyclase